MSINISLKINFIPYQKKEKINYKIIINQLLNHSWDLYLNNKANFLPLNDNDMYNWTSKEINKENLFLLLNQKHNAKEVIGISLYYIKDKKNAIVDDNVHEISLLFFEDHISISLSYYTKYLDALNKKPDYNWYEEKIIEVLREIMYISFYSFEYIQ